ncbi:YcxB family protein [Luteimonas sp. MJ246]|uniref:YcxB family protein n=1 Tax=Luteimonas sp. MJ174 TaxID=3129237 RepID=UPI0031BAABA7
MDTGPITFSVRYRLGEYLRFVTEHGFDSEASLRDLRGIRRLLAHLLLRTAGTVGFAWKAARVGRCRFELDGEGIRRHTRRGPGTLPWSRVKALHTYTAGFLIELEEGALPIPFRVLGAGQRNGILRLATAAGVACPTPAPP